MRDSQSLIYQRLIKMVANVKMKKFLDIDNVYPSVNQKIENKFFGHPCNAHGLTAECRVYGLKRGRNSSLSGASEFLILLCRRDMRL